MKKILILLTALFLSLASGCSEQEKLVDDIDSAATQTSAQGEYDDFPEPQSMRLKPDWSNWTDGTLITSHGMRYNLCENELGTYISEDSVIDGGIINIYLVNRFEIYPYEELDDAMVTALVMVNDKFCDFELDGKQSTEGMLRFESEVNKDLNLPLTVTDCELVKGRNKITVILAVYYPQIGHCGSANITRYMQSESEKHQSSELLQAERHEDVISYFDDPYILNESSNFVYKQNRYDEQKHCSYVNSGTEVRYRFINKNNAEDSAVKCRLLCLVLADGEPIDLLGEDKYILLPLSQSDIAFELPITKLDEKSKYTHLTFFYFDLNTDRQYYDEHLFCTE